MARADYSGRFSFNKPLSQCPACDNEIWCNVTVDVSPSDWPGGKDITLKGKISGMSVSHDCRPTALRGATTTNG